MELLSIFGACLAASFIFILLMSALILTAMVAIFMVTLAVLTAVSAVQLVCLWIYHRLIKSDGRMFDYWFMTKMHDNIDTANSVATVLFTQDRNMDQLGLERSCAELNLPASRLADKRHIYFSTCNYIDV